MSLKQHKIDGRTVTLKRAVTREVCLNKIFIIIIVEAVKTNNFVCRSSRIKFYIWLGFIV